jgi:hypothetical protein
MRLMYPGSMRAVSAGVEGTGAIILGGSVGQSWYPQCGARVAAKTRCLSQESREIAGATGSVGGIVVVPWNHWRLPATLALFASRVVIRSLQ